MKVKLLTDILIDGKRVYEGDEIDIDEAKKEVWVKKGWAQVITKEVKVKKETKELKVEKITKDEGSKD